MEQRTSLTEIIEYIDPGSLNYQDWVNVGMALKLEGYPVSVWDQWSQGKTFGWYLQTFQTGYGQSAEIVKGLHDESWFLG